MYFSDPAKFDECIYGGRSCKTVNEIPYIVRVITEGQTFNQKNKAFENITSFCGGSIISENYVLTAAHCVACTKDHHTTKITVVIGKSSKIKPSSGITSNVLLNSSTELVHEDYLRLNDGSHDIALLKLEKPLKLDGKKMASIVLSDYMEQYNANDQALISGWGLCEKNCTLKIGTVRIINADLCQKLYQDNQHKPTPDQICAGLYSKISGRILSSEFVAGGRKGDSGGPMVVSKNKKDRLVGITSWAAQCDNHPTVFTSVAFFRNWIKEKSGV